MDVVLERSELTLAYVGQRASLELVAIASEVLRVAPLELRQKVCLFLCGQHPFCVHHTCGQKSQNVPSSLEVESLHDF